MRYTTMYRKCGTANWRVPFFRPDPAEVWKDAQQSNYLNDPQPDTLYRASIMLPDICADGNELLAILRNIASVGRHRCLRTNCEGADLRVADDPADS